jgi:hypothetical protein
LNSSNVSNYEEEKVDSNNQVWKRINIFSHLSDSVFMKLFGYLIDDPDVVKISSQIASAIFWIYVAISLLGK